jgi:hypothetical protein
MTAQTMTNKITINTEDTMIFFRSLIADFAAADLTDIILDAATELKKRDEAAHENF